jgi:hypothetical protein
MATINEEIKSLMVELMEKNGMGNTGKMPLTIGEAFPNNMINNFLPNYSANFTNNRDGAHTKKWGALPVFDKNNHLINLSGRISEHGSILLDSIGYQSFVELEQEETSLIKVAKALKNLGAINILHILKMPQEKAMKSLNISDVEEFLTFIRILTGLSRIYPSETFDSIIKLGGCSDKNILLLYNLLKHSNLSCPLFICDHPELKFIGESLIERENRLTDSRVEHIINELGLQYITLISDGDTRILKLENKN